MAVESQHLDLLVQDQPLPRRQPAALPRHSFRGCSKAQLSLSNSLKIRPGQAELLRTRGGCVAGQVYCPGVHSPTQPPLLPFVLQGPDRRSNPKKWKRWREGWKQWALFRTSASGTGGEATGFLAIMVGTLLQISPQPLRPECPSRRVSQEVVVLAATELCGRGCAKGLPRNWVETPSNPARGTSDGWRRPRSPTPLFSSASLATLGQRPLYVMSRFCCR